MKRKANNKDALGVQHHLGATGKLVRFQSNAGFSRRAIPPIAFSILKTAL
jgi:hypothetical protein